MYRRFRVPSRSSFLPACMPAVEASPNEGVGRSLPNFLGLLRLSEPLVGFLSSLSLEGALCLTTCLSCQ